MADTDKRLKDLVSEIEAAEGRIASENQHKSEIYKRAKAEGFEDKALRLVVSERRKDWEKRKQVREIADLYHGILLGTEHATRAQHDQRHRYDTSTGEIIEAPAALAGRGQPIASAAVGESPAPLSQLSEIIGQLDTETTPVNGRVTIDHGAHDAILEAGHVEPETPPLTVVDGERPHHENPGGQNVTAPHQPITAGAAKGAIDTTPSRSIGAVPGKSVEPQPEMLKASAKVYAPMPDIPEQFRRAAIQGNA
jgi:uncharacterized protein (UPF0335 family)